MVHWNLYIWLVSRFIKLQCFPANCQPLFEERKFAWIVVHWLWRTLGHRCCIQAVSPLCKTDTALVYNSIKSVSCVFLEIGGVQKYIYYVPTGEHVFCSKFFLSFEHSLLSQEAPSPKPSEFSGITYLVGKITFKLLIHFPLAESAPSGLSCVEKIFTKAHLKSVYVVMWKNASNYPDHWRSSSVGCRWCHRENPQKKLRDGV